MKNCTFNEILKFCLLLPKDVLGNSVRESEGWMVILTSVLHAKILALCHRLRKS
jgi:hypothetical protein